MRTIQTGAGRAAAAAAAISIAGCAGMGTLTAEVSTYGSWPPERRPATFAFERLPSQAQRAEQQGVAENAARAALESAGFTPAAVGEEPDVLVQVGTRITRNDYAAWNDPLWWPGGGFGAWHYRPWGGPYGGGGWGGWGGWGYGAGYGAGPSSRYDEREVAMLIRDRSEGTPLYEAHARLDGNGYFGGGGGDDLNRGMFIAAMKDFPAVGLNPRTVVVQR